MLDDRTLERYADAIVRSCLAIGPGDLLAVHGEPAHRPLSLALAGVAYAAGADYVDVAFVEPALRRARVDEARPETLDYQPAWAEKRLRDLVAAHGASISINGPSDPTLMNGADPDRAARERSSRIPGQRVYLREVQRNALRFCVVAFPLEGWCAPVYPELDPAAATRQVALDLASFCRVADDDPPTRGTATSRCWRRAPTGADELELDRIVLRAPGTDLEVGMARGGKWCAADETTRARAPVPGQHADGGGLHEPRSAADDGHVPCTRPLALDGRRITASTAVPLGPAHRLGADNESDRSYLAWHVARDRGAARLGEVALVDATSRIGLTGRTYGITLLDENAVSHIAFGSGYASTRYPDGARVNDSQIHIDVMIGAPDMEVTGYTVAGRAVPIVRDGLLQLA